MIIHKCVYPEKILFTFSDYGVRVCYNGIIWEVDMFRIYPIESGEDRNIIRELFREYIQLTNDEINANFDYRLDVLKLFNEDMNTFEKYLPPSSGRLILAEQEGDVIGMGGVIKYKDDIGEIVRMYVRSAYRRRGIGKSLLEQILVEARELGYSRVYLGSWGFMKAAHALYSICGFEEIEPYPGISLPEELRPNWKFMEKKLE
jgi:N-acetylglutamate synthase-like GNAT family acetyltransferase